MVHHWLQFAQVLLQSRQWLSQTPYAARLFPFPFLHQQYYIKGPLLQPKAPQQEGHHVQVTDAIV